MLEKDIRDTILATPEQILEDIGVMKALLSADQKRSGKNVVDMRDVVMGRLEARLSALELAHNSAISAAYENMITTQQLHHAVLQLLEPQSLMEFSETLSTQTVKTLKVSAIRLILEPKTAASETFHLLQDPKVLPESFLVVEEGFIKNYLTQGRSIPVRMIMLRKYTLEDVQFSAQAERVYPENADQIKSEAAIQLELKNHGVKGLLVIAANNPDRFKPNHATDLLTFFMNVVEKTLSRFLPKHTA